MEEIIDGMPDTRCLMLDKKMKKGKAFRGQGVESIAQGAGGEIDFGI